MDTKDEIVDQLERLKQGFDARMDRQLEPIKDRLEKNISAVDNLLAGNNERKTGGPGTTFESRLVSLFEQNIEVIKSVASGMQHKARLETKALPMLSSTHITGDGVNTYNQKIGVAPGDRVNVRDLLPAVSSDSALWVNYTETVTGAPATQTEGQAKAAVEYAYTATTLTAQYIAGYTKFSKQLAGHLPFLQSTLTRSLMRDFLAAENSILSAQLIAAANGYDSSADTADLKTLIDILAGRMAAGYSNDFIAVSFAQYGSLLKNLYDSSNYLGSGSIVGTPGGGISVWNTPVVPVGWLANDKALIVDNSYVQRVVVDPLRVEFSEHDGDNFQKNLISARVEEMEVLSVLRGEAVSYFDFGNES